MRQVEIFDSSFLLEMHNWKMPKSDLYYPIVKLAKTCIENEFDEKDKNRFELFFKEVYENFVLSNRLILDVTEVEFQSSLVNLLHELTNSYLDEVLVVGAMTMINMEEQRIMSIETMEQGILRILDVDRKKRFDGGSNLKLDSDQMQISILPYALPMLQAVNMSFLIEEKNQNTIGYIKLEGDLETGSMNAEDVKLASRRMNQFDKLFPADFLIIDFTGLNYSWGDDFSIYPNRYRYLNLSKEEYDSLYLVLHENQISEGFRSLLQEDESRIYSSYENALNEIRSRIHSN